MNNATLQNILSRFTASYQQQHSIQPAQYKVMRHLTACRTKALGGQTVHCDACDFEQHRYHSCRNRHCPKCQQKATQKWCEAQLENVLPVPYYHVVFTLPHELNSWVQCHSEVIYRCLFEVVWHTLKTFGADQKRLNGELGMTAVLHTWGQNLSRHVHLHCLIPGGALSVDQTQWHRAKSNYLFPVKALSRHFRGKMVSALRGAYTQGELSRLNPAELSEQLARLMSKDWVVYSKAYINKPDTVVRYLGRYTRKIALSESRIRSVDDDHVVFDYKDYRDGKDKHMQLSGIEFLRRFLLHVLPQGFMRIRHYGFLSNRTRRQKLAVIRQCLQMPVRKKESRQGTDAIHPVMCICPKCKKGHLQMRVEIPATPLHGR